MNKLTLLLLVLMLAWAGIVRAQPEDIPPIALDENQFAEITRAQPAVEYRLQTVDDALLIIEIRSETARFAPMLRIYDAENDLVAQYPNPNAADTLRVLLTPDPDRAYDLHIQGVDSTRGAFVLSVARASASDPAQLPILEITSGQNFQDRVSPQVPQRRYQITSQADSSLLVQMQSSAPDGGPSMVLSTLDGAPLASTRADLLGGAFFIPPATDQRYLLQVVHSGAAREEVYSVSMSRFAEGTSLGVTLTSTPIPTDTPTPLPTDTPPATETPPASPTDSATRAPPIPSAPSDTPTPDPTATIPPTRGPVIIPADGPCAVTPSGGIGVNVRRGPSTEYEIMHGLGISEALRVTGRNADNRWWQVEYDDGLFGWVADSAIRRGGDCGDIGIAPVDPPRGANNTPTSDE